MIHVVIDLSLPQHCNPIKIQGLEMLSQEPVWVLWTAIAVALLKMLLIQTNCTKGEIPLNAHSLNRNGQKGYRLRRQESCACTDWLSQWLWVAPPYWRL